MKLIIREYLSLLRESGELDVLIPDLLFSKGIIPLAYPKKGLREYGVDAIAVGKNDNGEKTLFILTIKCGNIDRANWDVGLQAVRPSLNEIKDGFLTSHIRPEHKDLPKEIILCTGGHFIRDIWVNWKGFCEENNKENLLFKFWGGNELASMVEEYMLNDQLLPEELRSNFRRVLALINEPDNSINDYNFIIHKLFENLNKFSVKKSNQVKKAKKVFATIHLCLVIVYKWAVNQNNLKPAYLAGEMTLLLSYDFFKKKELLDHKTLTKYLLNILNTNSKIGREFFQKYAPVCKYRDALSNTHRSHLLNNIAIFELLGIMSTTGFAYYIRTINLKNPKDDFSKTELLSIVKVIKDLITNNPMLNSPYYDNHIIDISAALLLFHCADETDFAKKWIRDMTMSIDYAFRGLGNKFPIHTDSFDDLVALNESGRINKEKLFKCSTLIPILAQWTASFDLEETYQQIRGVFSRSDYKDVTFTVWYPNENIEDNLYTSRNSHENGNSEVPHLLCESFDEYKSNIKKVQDKTVPFKSLTFAKNFLFELPLMASRHYRTPVLPQLRQLSVLEKNNGVKEE
jgi:hypothetical protein